MYLRKKDHTEYTGAESYIDDCLTNEDPTWIPERRALCLEQDDEIQLDELIEQKTEAVLAKVAAGHLKLQTDVHRLSAKMTALLTENMMAK